MSRVRIVLAHIERYYRLQSPSVWNRLYECGILMQVNASFFSSFSTKRKAHSLLRKGGIHFIGSDCHNTSSRKPMMDKAIDAIRKKFGDEYLYQMTEYGYSMLEAKNLTV